MLQHSGHADRGKVSGEKRPGGRRVLVYPDDFSHFHPSGAVHGQRGAVFHPLRPEGRGGADGEHPGFFSTHRGGSCFPQCAGICLPGSYPGLSAGAG